MAQTSEREKLIRAFVEDGDKLWASNNAAIKLNGKLAWSFAEKYSPNDPGIQERVKHGRKHRSTRNRDDGRGTPQTTGTLLARLVVPISLSK